MRKLEKAFSFNVGPTMCSSFLSTGICVHLFPPFLQRETTCYFLFASLEQALSDQRQMSHSGCLVWCILVLLLCDHLCPYYSTLKFKFMSTFSIINTKENNILLFLCHFPG